MELVRKVVAGPPAAVSLRASALNHELGYHAVEDQAVIVIAFFFFAGGGVDKFLCALCQPDEILDRLGCFLVKQPANDIAQRSLENCVGSSRSCHLFSFA